MAGVLDSLLDEDERCSASSQTASVGLATKEGAEPSKREYQARATS